MMNGQQPDVYLAYTYIGANLTVVFTSADSSCPTPSGMPKSQTVTEGRQAKRPSPDPKADGCLFDGWFTKDAGNDSKIAYDFSQPVTGNITLVAHWTRMDTRWALNPDKGNVLGGQHVTITPPAINRGIRFSQASAGGSFSIGVASDGNAYAWGNNQYGQLAQKPADASMQKTPVRIPLPDGADSGFTYTQVAAGDSHVLAIGSDGIVYSWGRNDHGQLGDGTATDRYKPQPVKDTSGQPFKAVQVSAGVADSAAIDDKGHVYTWGSESNDQNTYSPAKLVPTQAASINGSEQTLIATQVSVKWAFVMALDNDGTIYTWGYDSFSRSGNSADYAPNPTPLPNQSFEATQISAGGWHALAVDTDSNTWAWGYNQYGQLGNGTTSGTSPQATPVRVQNPAGGDQGFKAKSISAGVFHAIAIDNDGRTWAWGRNGYGQLGINSTSNASAPTPVRNPSKPGDASQKFPANIIGAGDSHSLAVESDGNLWTWGDNQYGQLGNNQTAAKSTIPVAVAFDPTPAVLTGVKFGGIDGTSLYRNTDGTWSITNPPHDAGPVDVAVDWTIDQAAQATAHLGYTYEGILPRAGSTGLLVLLAAGLLATAGATAAASHQRENRRQ
ncbi:InlB B-repeat-containing protein [Bifidobacterium choladohabitans]|uniref:RCC1 domain-containing protein n=1 Tax=Bifidobacterium TaxID=1678 RepID=UPI001E6001AA|nr:InlB B-repeat-containing protein [Bifidobacterium choladohabitans]